MIYLPIMSSPTRGTWIEINMWAGLTVFNMVVPHAGDVDRNKLARDHGWTGPVVPHAGDVDRNSHRS